MGKEERFEELKESRTQSNNFWNDNIISDEEYILKLEEVCDKYEKLLAEKDEQLEKERANSVNTAKSQGELIGKLVDRCNEKDKQLESAREVIKYASQFHSCKESATKYLKQFKESE